MNEFMGFLDHPIHSRFDFIDPVKKVIASLISGDLETLARQDCMSPTGLSNIVERRRSVYHEKHPEKSLLQVPKGLYWFIIPPDSEIRKAIENARNEGIDKSSQFAIDRTSQFNRSTIDFYRFTLSDIENNYRSFPDSEWGVELPMWTEDGESSLTLLLLLIIKSENLFVKIEEIEIM